jgi:DNA-binding response OmpR family regulator
VEELEERAKKSGADGFIGKTEGTDGLRAGVRAVFEAPEPKGAKKKARILIVDDSETTVLLLENELKGKGFEVFTADTADKATKIILKKKTRPDLVLLDVRMPNVNGEQFCRFIKSNALFAGIKVLLCSGEDPEELRRICREAGADGYVAKDAILAKVLAGDLG